ncbi:MAG TPA: hypothetical protein DHN33_08490 [Eubacteriaceae bacterium]|nr:hypothetical protein [Eubacteriaceae bacterium]
MHQSDFNPVTISIQMSHQEQMNLGHWAEICRYFLNNYALKITENRKAYIGHIKGIALLDHDSHIKLSIYKPSIPAELNTKGSVLASSISLTLNSFVYGVNEEDSLKALAAVAKKVEREFMLSITYNIEAVHHHHQ